jgi:hypothetical protein
MAVCATGTARLSAPRHPLRRLKAMRSIEAPFAEVLQGWRGQLTQLAGRSPDPMRTSPVCEGDFDARSTAQDPMPTGPTDPNAVQPAREDADGRHRPPPLVPLSVHLDHVFERAGSRSLDKHEPNHHGVNGLRRVVGEVEGRACFAIRLRFFVRPPPAALPCTQRRTGPAPRAARREVARQRLDADFSRC